LVSGEVFLEAIGGLGLGLGAGEALVEGPEDGLVVALLGEVVLEVEVGVVEDDLLEVQVDLVGVKLQLLGQLELHQQLVVPPVGRQHQLDQAPGLHKFLDAQQHHVLLRELRFALFLRNEQRLQLAVQEQLLLLALQPELVLHVLLVQLDRADLAYPLALLLLNLQRLSEPRVYYLPVQHRQVLLRLHRQSPLPQQRVPLRLQVKQTQLLPLEKGI